MSDLDLDAITARKRHRRLRRSAFVRDLVRENAVVASDLVLPVFVIPGDDEVEPIDAMPGVSRHSVDRLVAIARRASDAGLPALAIFPNPPQDARDVTGSGILDPDNLVCRAASAIKDAVPEIGIITDTALDPFTSHGHDGVFEDGWVLNDRSVDIFCRAAVLQAEAGADVIAPSDMMDGRVGAIRDALDAAGHRYVSILSYAAKYASAFYGPYREAVGTLDNLVGDKRGYFMDPANSDEALREVEADVEQGADMVMVKPAGPYLDVVSRVKRRFAMPTLAYQVSGEYSMIAAAGANGWIDRDRARDESLLAIKRAGADAIFTYFALEVAEAL